MSAQGLFAWLFFGGLPIAWAIAVAYEWWQKRQQKFVDSGPRVDCLRDWELDHDRQVLP